jgi:hypothetical protein
MNVRTPVLAFALAATASSSLADVIHDENLHGDLSNDRLAPTAYSLSLGANSVLATSSQGDREFIALTVPAGAELSAILQISYAGDDDVAFAAVQAGPQLTVDPDLFDPAGLLGWTHFGPFAFPNGSDILPSMGMGFGADGFSPPLPAGTYTFWLQQAGPSLTSFQLDFIVTPAPGAASMLAVGVLAAVRRRR